LYFLVVPAQTRLLILLTLMQWDCEVFLKQMKLHAYLFALYSGPLGFYLCVHK